MVWSNEGVSGPPRVLCRSQHYVVIGDFEVVRLTGSALDGGGVVVGDFYGDAVEAVITSDEQWCLSVGEGLIAYRLVAPWLPYRRDIESDQWFEFGRDGVPIWFDSAVVAGSRVELVDEEGGRYVFDCDDVAVRPLV